MIKRAVRNAVRAIYAYTCGYCGLTEADAGAELTIDHFQPTGKGGTNARENLVYACAACNQFKAKAWEESDSPVLHPLTGDLAKHVRENDDGTLVGITDAGTRHIETLHLNRAPLVQRRQKQNLLRTVVAKYTEVLTRMTRLENKLDAVTKAVLRETLDDTPRRGS